MADDYTLGENNATYDPNRVLVIKEKIKSAFCNVYKQLSAAGFIIQFWAPIGQVTNNINNVTDKKFILKTQNQPFALTDPCFSKYRSSCLRYTYTASCTNRFPALVPDLRLRQGLDPLVASALASGLTSCFFLPVFDHPSASSCCVGLVECSVNRPDIHRLLVIFNALKTALQIVGLNTLYVQACGPYKNTQGLTLASNEIANVLQSVCASHSLPLGHVWFSCQNDTQTKQNNALKLFGYCDDSDSRVKEYYDTCDAFPLKIGEGFAGKSLQTYESVFCKNIHKLTDYGQLDSLDIKCSCLAISLKSIHTGDDVDYAFEFLWPKTRNYFFLLESLILTLKRCLPSFKLSSGAQLGDELQILDVQNSTGHGTGFFKILQRNHLSQVPQRSVVDIQVRESDYSVVQQHNTNFIMTDDATSGRDNKEISNFLAAFPIQLQCIAARSFPHMRVFWSQTEQPQSKLSSSAHNTWVIHEKIKSAFLNIYSSHLNGLIQFWAPVEISGRWLLSTFNEPFGLAHLDPFHQNYRLHSLNYRYSINVNKFEVENDPMIINGAPATAFMNQLPQVVPTLKAHHGNPLVRSAAECGLTCSLLLPVFIHPFQSSSPSSCIGVLECSIMRSGLLVMFNELRRALESVGLHTFHAQESQPHKNIQGLKHVTDEIEDAIKIVCESHHITLSQVWVAYKNDKDMPSSSSVEETQTYAVKLTGYCVDSNDDFPYSLKEYYDMCDVLPLKIRDGLTGKTFQTYEPQICGKVDKLSDSGLLVLLPANTECSCFVICLRSIHTGDIIDYAFEFLWPQNRFCFFLLESLLVTLERCLPNFKFASGAQLGDELSTLKTRFVAAEEYCILSSEAMNPVLTRQEHDHYGKRKYSELRESQAGNQDQHSSTTSSSSSSSVRLHNDRLIITAKYEDREIVFYVPDSSTKLADVKKNIDEKYDLGNYKLEYLWYNDWMMLDDDKDWENCIEISKSLRPLQPIINLRILC